ARATAVLPADRKRAAARATVIKARAAARKAARATVVVKAPAPATKERTWLKKRNQRRKQSVHPRSVIASRQRTHRSTPSVRRVDVSKKWMRRAAHSAPIANARRRRRPSPATGIAAIVNSEHDLLASPAPTSAALAF